ncbi:MAG: hypothetical protein Q7S96_05085 [bacterium]|nr:hypothetical protein [bacterium]
MDTMNPELRNELCELLAIARTFTERLAAFEQRVLKSTRPMPDIHVTLSPEAVGADISFSKRVPDDVRKRVAKLATTLTGRKLIVIAHCDDAPDNEERLHV